MNNLHLLILCRRGGATLELTAMCARACVVRCGDKLLFSTTEITDVYIGLPLVFP